MNEDRISATAPPEPATPSHQIPSDPPSDSVTSGSVTSGPVSSGAVSSDPAPPGVLAEQTEAFAGRLFEAYISCLEVLAVQLGDDLGLYRTLAAADWSTAAELAARGRHPRAVRPRVAGAAGGGRGAGGGPAGGARRGAALPPAGGAPPGTAGPELAGLSGPRRGPRVVHRPGAAAGGRGVPGRGRCQLRRLRQPAGARHRRDERLGVPGRPG